MGTMGTRRYPWGWGIQRSVSIHQIPHKSGDGGSPDQLKFKVPRSVQIFILGGGGGPDQHSWNTWMAALKDFWAKYLPNLTREAFASQITPHTLRVWRLNQFPQGAIAITIHNPKQIISCRNRTGQQFNSDTSFDLVAMKIVIVILLCERSLTM